MKNRRPHKLPRCAVRALAGSIAALLAVQSTRAATLTWDANGATSGQTDGAGVWLTANQWWTGSANTTWVSGSDAIFGVGGTGGAVTLASPTTAQTITFNSFTGTYTLGTTGQALTTNAGITINSGAAAVTIISPVTLGGSQSWTNGSASTFTVSGAVTGGANTLTLDGTGNGLTTLTGGLTFSGAGGLAIGKSGTLGTTISGGTITLGGTGGIVINNGASAVSLGAASVTAAQTWTNNSSNSMVQTGALALGANTLTLGGGNFTFSQANTGTGAINLNAGNLIATAAGAFGPSTETLTFGGGNLELRSAATTFTGALNLSGAGETITINPASLGNGVTHIVSGAATLGTQTTVMSAGSLTTNNTAYGLTLSGATSFAGANTNATFTINGNGSGAGTLTLSGGFNTGGNTQTLTLNNGSGTGANTAAISGAFTGTAGTLVLAGSAPVTVGALTSTANAIQVNSTTGGIYTFSGASTFTGGVTLTSGTLKYGLAGTAGTSGPLGNGGTFTINGGVLDTAGATIVGLNVTPITLGGDFAYSTSAGTAAANTLTIPGAITMAADRTVTLNGLGALTLSGLLTNTADSVRTLTVNNGTGAGATSILTIGSYNLTGTGSTAARTDVINGSGRVTISGIVADGVSAGSGLTYSGSSTLTLGGANTFTGGLAIRQGTVVANVSNATTVSGAAGPSANAITLGDSAGGSASLLANSFTVSNAVNLGASAVGTLTIGNNAGATAAIFSGAVGLNGNNLTVSSTGTGSTTLSGGITGTGNLTITNGTTTATTTISTALLNNTGTITNNGAGSGLTTISGGIGSSVTGITESSTTSALTISTTGVTVGGSQSWTNNGTTFTVSSAVTGGANTLTLNGTGAGLTTLTGGLTFSGAGGLIIGKSGTLGTTISGGTITLGGTGGIVINSGASAVSLGAASVTAPQTWTNNSSTAMVQTGVLALGANTLTLGGGDFIFSQTNTGTGAINLNAGNLIATLAGAFGPSTETLTFGGGNLELRSAATTFTGALNLSGAGETITINPASLGNGVTHIVSGAATLGTQTTVMSAGSLTNNNTPYGLTLSGATSFSAASSNATFTINGNGSGAGTLTLSGGFNTNGSTQTLTLNNGSGSGANAAVISGAFAGSAGTLELAGSVPNVTVGSLTTTANVLRLSGTGIYTLNGTSTFTGGILLNNASASYIATTAGGLSNAGQTKFNVAGTTLNLRAGATSFTSGIDSSAFGGTIIAEPATAVAGVTQTMTLANTLGTNTIIMSPGQSTANTAYGLTLSGANSFSGANTNATFTINGNGTAAGTLTLSGGFNTNGSTQTLTLNNGSGSGVNTATISGAFTGSAGTLVLAGSAPVTVGALTSTANAIQVNSTTGGIYTFNGASTFTGGVTMTAGTASFTNTGLGSGKITFAGNSTLQWGASTTTDLSSRLIINTGVTATLDTGANNVAFASVFGLENNSKGTLNKIGTGTLTLSYGANQFAGNIVITNGNVALGNQYGMWQSAYDTTGSTGAIGLNVTGYATPWLGGLAGSVNLATAITGYGSVTSLTLNPQSGSSVSYGGVIANGAANMTLNKTGFGTQTLTNTNTYSGATTVWAGTLALSGASGTAQNSAFSVLGGTLLLDNTTALADRLNNSTALSLGSLTLKSNTAAGTQAETVGATTFAVGGKVTVDLNGGTAQTTLAMGTVTRSAGAAIDFVGVGGTLGGGASSPNVTTTGTFPGGSNGILPWATVNGTTWAGTASTTSIVAYAGTFVDPTSAASAAASNAQLTGSGTMNAVKSFNSLNVISSGASQSFDLSTAGVLTLTSGGILKSGTNAYTISGSAANAITAGTELIAHVDGGALTISAPLNTAIVNIAKGGTGDLILSGTRAATLSGAISIAGGQLEFQGASTTLSGVISGAGGLTVNLNAGQTLTFSNNSNSYSGQTIVKGGYLANSAYTNIGLPGGNYQTAPSTNTSLAGTNLVLQGGVYIPAYTFSKDLGAGPNQIQILAGTSGFVVVANSGGQNSFVLDSGRELVWGSTYFNPTAFVFSTVNGANITTTIANGFDLAGSTRTVMVGDATYNGSTTGGVSALSGAIRTSSGTAGLTKTGPGLLLLTGASTYNGATTVSAGTLSFQGNANVASANPLGQSSAAAANLLLANGATLQYSGAAASIDRGFTINGTTAGDGASLDASGSAAINFTNTASPAYGTVDQTRTLTLTGTNTNNNTLAANIADNGAGAVSLSKTGAGLWVLSGTSSYTGPTTITAGTLSVSATANLGGATSNLVFNGGTLQVTNTTNLPNFSTIGHTVVFNSGKTVGLDISSGTFTVDQVLNQGTGGLTKAGAGTLLINSAHTYTGFTTISAGTLRLDSGGSIAGPIINNSIYLINQNATTGTAPLTNISGSGSIAVGTGFTITINPGNGLSFNALNTTGGGSFALSGAGVTTPTLGGLVGTTGNLSSAFSSGYTGVSNLTLNTVSGSSFTYGGVIDNGATPMSLTKTGAGTQTLTGTNTYTGTTFLNGGVLSVGDGTTIGKISGTTALQFNGGTLTFRTLGANSNVDAIPDGAGITVNTSSTFNATSANAGGGSNNETVGAVTLNAGQMNFNWTNGGSSGTLMTLTSLSRSGTASAVFNSGFASNNSRWAVTGSGSTTAGQIIGPWYTTGGNGAGFASTDYAVFSSGFVAQAAIAGSAETTWTTAANAYTTSAGATVTLTGTRTITALRNTGATTVLTLASGADLQTYGLLNGVSTLLTVAPGTGGVLTTPANGGNLYVNAGAGAITVSAPIKDSGGSPTAVTLVKNGSNTLTLSSTTSNYSGGTVINGGTLAATADTNLGASVASANLITSAQAITVNGDATLALGNGGVTYYRSILLNGANLAFPGSGNNPTIAGAVTGTGGVSIQGGNAVSSVTLSSLNNTFTGAVGVGTGTGSSTGPTISVASLVDSVGAGNIIFNYGYAATSATFSYMATAVVPLTLNNRQIVVANNSAGNIGIATIQNLNTTNAITINTPLSVTTSLAGTHTLALDAVAGPVNAFNGTISDGGAGVFISLSKTGAGTWAVTGNNTFTGGVTVSTGTLVLSGTNQYTGATNITNGTLSVNSVSDYNVASAIGAASSGAIALANTGSGNTGTLQYTGSGNSTNRQVQVGPISQNNGGGQILNNGTGALIFSATTFNGDDSTTGGSAGPRTLTLGGTYTGVSEIQGAILANTGAPTSRDINIVKNGIGTWSFAGANTYTGGNQTGNTINLGTLRGTQNSGTPFGTAAVTINAGTLSLAPTGSGSAVSLTGGTKAAGTLFTYNADAILSLNKGTQTSLTYTFGGTGTTTARGTNGTLILSASDITNFGAAGGNAERFIMNGTAPTQVNTIVSGVVIQDRNNSNAGDFAAYDATNGFTKATYTLSNTFSGSTNASLVNIASPTSTGTIAAYAVKVSGTTLTNTGTLTLGGSATGVAGLILNNGTISGGTSLTTPTSVAVELTVYTSGTSVISTPILTATSQAGMSVFGPGTLDLSSSTGNTFTGGLRINNSTLIVNNNNQLGGAASTVTLTGGTLQTSGANTEINFNGGASYHGYTLNAGQDQTGGTFNVTGGTTTLTNTGGVIGGSGSLTKTGAGTFVLTGTVTNTYTGGTIVNNGTLQLGASNMLADTGAVTVGGGTFDLQTFSDTVGAVTLTSGSIIGSGGTLTGTSYDVRNGAASANLAGSGAAMTKTTSGTVTLSGTNSFTGMTTVSAGTLQFAKMVSLYNNTPASWTAANINVKSGATFAVNVDSNGTSGFDVGNLNTLLTNISVAGSATAGLQSGAILGFDTSTATGGTFTQGNAIANSTGASGGAIGVTKLGTGTLVLNQSNTYARATNVNNGTLSFNTVAAGAAAQSLGQNTGASAVTLGVAGTSSGILNYVGTSAATLDKNIAALGNGSDTIQNSASGTSSLLTLSGTLTKNGTTLTLNGGTSGIAVTGQIVGANANSDLTITGGTTTVTNNNTYNGATVVTSTGTLQIDNNGSTTNGQLSATTGITVNNGGTLLMTGASTANTRINNAANLTLAGGTFGVGAGVSGVSQTLGTLTLSANSTLDFGTGNGNTLTFSGLALNGNTLNVYDWSGTRYANGATTDSGDPTQDRLVFTSDVSSQALSQINFYSGGVGSAWVGNGKQISFSGSFEIAPVPEPATVFGALALLGLVGFRERRRLRGLVG